MAIRKIVSRSIGTDVIAAEDLANNSVTVAEITDGAVTSAKMNGLTGSSSGIIQADGDGSLSVTTADLVDDTTPQLGGDLDLNSNDITGTGNIDISGDVTITDSSNQPTIILSTPTAANNLTISRDSSTGHYNFKSDETGSSIQFFTDPDGNGPVNRMSIDRYGYVLKPNSPAFYARGLTTTSDTAGQIFIFPTAEINRGSGYNTSTGKFTAPVSGVYHLVSQTYRDTSSSDSSMYMVKNSTAITEFRVATSGAAGYAYMTGSIVVEMSAGDTAHVEVRTGSCHANSSWSYFGGHLIG